MAQEHKHTVTGKVEHEYTGQRYRIVIERAAGVKTGDGFKIEVNGDDIEQVRKDASDLYHWATPQVMKEKEN